MDLKVSRCLLYFLLVLFAAQLPVNAQSVPCSTITRNTLVLGALLDSYSKDAAPDLQESPKLAPVDQMLWQFSPIIIQQGDASF